jgi:hypothetical protein
MSLNPKQSISSKPPVASTVSRSNDTGLLKTKGKVNPFSASFALTTTKQENKGAMNLFMCQRPLGFEASELLEVEFRFPFPRLHYTKF